MKPLVYVAGPMRGLPNFNRSAFASAAKALAAAGWHVMNPLDFERIVPCESAPGVADERRLAALLAVELSAVARADAVCLLRGWERSKGARAELAAFLSANPDGQVIVQDGGAAGA